MNSCFMVMMNLDVQPMLNWWLFSTSRIEIFVLICFVLFSFLTSASPLISFWRLWRYKMLQQTSGVEESGVLRWELFLLLILAWIIIYFCIFKGVKSTGKVREQRDNETEEKVWQHLTQPPCVCVQVVYFTALFPYVILIILLINNVQLPGALDGIKFFIVPDWEKLLSVEVREKRKHSRKWK